MMLWSGLAAAGAAIWLCILVLPWQPWRVRERLEPETAGDAAETGLADVTVLIPARDEAAVIGDTLAALGRQGRGLRVILVDDPLRRRHRGGRPAGRHRVALPRRIQWRAAGGWVDRQAVGSGTRAPARRDAADPVAGCRYHAPARDGPGAACQEGRKRRGARLGHGGASHAERLGETPAAPPSSSSSACSIRSTWQTSRAGGSPPLRADAC